MLFNFIQILNSNSNASEQFLNRIFFSYQVNEKLWLNVNFANFQFNDRTLRLHFLLLWNQSNPSSWQPPHKRQTTHPAIINFHQLSIVNYQLSPIIKPQTTHPAVVKCHQSCQFCCRHKKAQMLAPMENLPWKKMAAIKSVKSLELL